jgi:hypothetical protein
MQGRVFVVMPFREETEDLWEFGIRPAAEDLGWQCNRADTVASPGFIVAQVYQEIADADVIVGEMTGQNPNVFYEIGFAHALGKPTLLLSKSSADLTAFDTRGFQHAFHGARIENARRIVSSYLNTLDLGAHREPLLPGAKVLYEWPSAVFDDPFFSWRPDEKDSRLDVNGGQSIEQIPPANRFIRVRDTEQLWNWRRGRSIMQLVGRTHEISHGDRVCLSVVARIAVPAVFGFIGDGGKQLVEGKKSWSRSWKDAEFRLKPMPTWQHKTLTILVEPTVEGYDPKTRGTTIYLTSRTDGGTADIRSVRVLLVSSSAPNPALNRADTALSRGPAG